MKVNRENFICYVGDIGHIPQNDRVCFYCSFEIECSKAYLNLSTTVSKEKVQRFVCEILGKANAGK